MAKPQGMEQPQSLFSLPLSERDQDPEAASFMEHLRGLQFDTNMLPTLSQDAANQFNMYNGSSTHTTHQEAPQGSNIVDKTNDNNMDTDIYSRIDDASANASILPQPRTLYSEGASSSSTGGSHGNVTSRQVLRLSISGIPNAVANIFAHGTPQNVASPPDSSNSNKHTHGIASGLSSVSSGLGISLPNYSGSFSPSAAPPGLFKGLGLVSGIGAAAASAGYGNEQARVINTSGEAGLQSSFGDFRTNTVNKTTAEGDNGDTPNTGYPLFPHSPSPSPFLSAHSRPLTPNSEAHASPSAYPPESPYPSPGPSPLALSPAGGPSQGPYSPGPEGSGAEGDDVSPTQPRGRLRGHIRPQLPMPQHISSAGPWSAGSAQQSQMMQGGTGGNFIVSRRSDAVGVRHSRSRGQSVGEGYTGAGSRGASPYPVPSHGDSGSYVVGRRPSASAIYVASQPQNLMNGGSPHSRDIPPLEIYGGSAASSREPSLGPRDPGLYISNPYSHPYPQQPQFQQAHSDQYLVAPLSPHSPNYGAQVPGVGSPTTGVHIGTPISYHSPHSLSPHSLSPHSGPPPTPSPELGGPNLTGGYGGSAHSSPGLGLDPMGMVGSEELQFPMDAAPNPIQLGNMTMPENGAQYTQGAYSADGQLTGVTSEFVMPMSSGFSAFPGSGGMDHTWTAQLHPLHQHQPDMEMVGMNSWSQDQNTMVSQLTTEQILAAYPNDAGTAAGIGAYSMNAALSVQANPEEIEALLREPIFWQEPPNSNTAPLDLDPGNRSNAPHVSAATGWIGNANEGHTHSIDPHALQQQPGQIPYHHSLDPQTVPPSPAKGTVLPWDASRQLPPGGVNDWQIQQTMMPPPNMHGQEPMPQKQNNHPIHPNQNPAALAVPPRRVPTRRRSKSDPYNIGQSHAPQPSSSTSGYASTHVHNSPRKQPGTLSRNSTMGFGAKHADDVVLADENGPGLKLRRTLPTMNPARGHRQTASAAVPSFVVDDWSDRTYGQTQHLRPPHGSSQSYQEPKTVSHGIAPLQEHYGAQHQGPPSYVHSGHQSYAQHPQLTHTVTYPPPNPVPELPLAGPSTLGRLNPNTKQKQQGQRNEVDKRKLAVAFTNASKRPDPALRFLLDLILVRPFYLQDAHEPLRGTPEGDHLFAEVRHRFPDDSRFAPRSDSRFASQPVDNESRDSQSIFMVFTENNQCLICDAQKDRTGRALGHVRSDIGHRPYHCSCPKCSQSQNPRKFFSENLLDDHLKGQKFKQKCDLCDSSIRRGGMKRHLSAKHKGAVEGAQGVHDNDEDEDEDDLDDQ